MVDLPSMDFVYSMAFLLFYLIIMIIAMKKKRNITKKTTQSLQDHSISSRVTSIHFIRWEKMSQYNFY